MVRGDGEDHRLGTVKGQGDQQASQTTSTPPIATCQPMPTCPSHAKHPTRVEVPATAILTCHGASMEKTISSYGKEKLAVFPPSLGTTHLPHVGGGDVAEEPAGNAHYTPTTSSQDKLDGEPTSHAPTSRSFGDAPKCAGATVL